MQIFGKESRVAGLQADEQNHPLRRRHAHILHAKRFCDPFGDLHVIFFYAQRK